MAAPAQSPLRRWKQFLGAAMAAPAQSPLRRWKQFLGAFESVDAAIEASDPALSRDEFRRARVGILELLRDAADDDHAEQLCLVLDDVMAESLETLRLVPVAPNVLATTDIAKSVGALRKHHSERVRDLAGGIMRKLDTVKNVIDEEVPAQSALRRWKRFLSAFESVDAAIEAADPVLSRDEFRRARVGIVEQLCDADDDDQAERLCLVLDDLMAKSLETLRLVTVAPKVLATTDLVKSVGALRKHHSGRVRDLAGGIMHKLDTVKNIIDEEVPADATKKQPVMKIQDSDRVLKTAKIVAQPPLPKIMVSPAAGIVGGDRAELCSEERLEAAKRKFHQGYREAHEVKRLRKPQLVEAPEMLKQRQRSRASCARSTVKKTFSVTKHLHGV